MINFDKIVITFCSDKSDGAENKIVYSNAATNWWWICGCYFAKRNISTESNQGVEKIRWRLFHRKLFWMMLKCFVIFRKHLFSNMFVIFVFFFFPYRNDNKKIIFNDIPRIISELVELLFSCSFLILPVLYSSSIRRKEREKKVARQKLVS